MPRNRSKQALVGDVRKALKSLGSEISVGPDLELVETTLEALASTILDLAGNEDDATRTLSEVAELLKDRREFGPLIEATNAIERLEQYASAFEYGDCVLDDEEFSDAEECRSATYEAVLEVLDAFA